MSVEEFHSWQAFYAVEPWGSPVADQHFATLCTLFYSANCAANTVIPDFFDRDPLETARRRAEIAQQQSIEDNIRAFFAPRVKMVEAPEPDIIPDGDK